MFLLQKPVQEGASLAEDPPNAHRRLLGGLEEDGRRRHRRRRDPVHPGQPHLRGQNQGLHLASAPEAGRVQADGIPAASVSAAAVVIK